MIRKTNFDVEFENLQRELRRCWDANNLIQFPNICHTMIGLFTNKIQTVINEKNLTYTFDLESGNTEAKLHKMNSMMDEILKKNEQLSLETDKLKKIETELNKKDESVNKN